MNRDLATLLALQRCDKWLTSSLADYSNTLDTESTLSHASTGQLCGILQASCHIALLAGKDVAMVLPAIIIIIRQPGYSTHTNDLCGLRVGWDLWCCDRARPGDVRAGWARGEQRSLFS